jgi:tryptophanyl-tRNA synthetase
MKEKEMKGRARILTGHRPSGPRHIGHLVGTLETWAKLQDEYECYFLMADLHVLTTDYEHPGGIRRNVVEALSDWLAAGIDPERAQIVLQSALGEHARLAVLLANLVTVARLERNPTYKEQVKQLKLTPSLGLLSYPVLQSADILLYKAQAAPVGEDQLPHLELTRELARRFNQLYGDTFPEPEPVLAQMRRLPGTDNRAMHASYGNTITLKETEEETTRKIMNMYTDPTRLHASDPGHVEGNTVFTYLEVFDPDREEVEDFKRRYRAGKIGDVEIKQRLAQALNERLRPLRQRRAKIASDPDRLVEIVRSGTERARTIVQATLQEVEEKMGVGALTTGQFFIQN